MITGGAGHHQASHETDPETDERIRIGATFPLPDVNFKYRAIQSFLTSWMVEILYPLAGQVGAEANTHYYHGAFVLLEA